MRRSDLVEATVAVLRKAETSLPDWVVKLIETAAQEETDIVAKSQLESILENIEIAEQEDVPLCQDTGLPIFHLELGRNLRVPFDLRYAIAEGVRIATESVPLRPNAVDPLTRINTNDNTGPGMPDLILDLVEGNELKITAFPKGAGSENMGSLAMLNPADDPLDFVLETVAQKAGKACPPVFVGIGIGGSFDLAARLAKKALLKMPGSSETERDFLAKINELGIGPMGLGGDTSALGIKIETACCHTASLPVAVNFQCWANRSASARVGDEGWNTD
ncbi:MAG: fumarate hydratase [Methanotrichaceae archaeon]